MTFAVQTNRMKPYLDPALRPVEAAWSKPYFDESNILADFLEVSESISHDNDTNVTAENDTHSLFRFTRRSRHLKSTSGSLDCEQPLFGQSRLISAGLEESASAKRAKAEGRRRERREGLHPLL